MIDLKDIKPELIIVGEKAFDKLTNLINNPPKPNKALADLMKRRTKWRTNDNHKH